MKLKSFRHIKKLSSYLDGKVSNSEKRQIADNLAKDQQSQEIFNHLRQVKFLLKKTPKLKVPRNFQLTKKMVGMKPPIPRSVPIFRMASVTAALVLMVSFAISDIFPTIIGPKSSAVTLMAQQGELPAYGVGGGDSAAESQVGEPALAPEIDGTNEIIPSAASDGEISRNPEASQLENAEPKTITQDQAGKRFGLDPLQIGLLISSLLFITIAISIRQYGVFKWRKR